MADLVHVVPDTLRPGSEYVGFTCPGCDDYHQIRTGENGWTWNGSTDAPTFSPSLLVTYEVTNHPERDQRCHSSSARAGSSSCPTARTRSLGRP